MLSSIEGFHCSTVVLMEVAVHVYEYSYKYRYVPVCRSPFLYWQLLEETSILTDGCLIDLCGVTLMWRSAMGLDQGLVR